MGGATDGSFFDGGRNFDRGLETLQMWDIKDIIGTHPQHLTAMAEKAIQANNPEMAIFITGILAARYHETPQPQRNGWVTKRVGSRHPSEHYTYTHYRTALETMLPQVVELPYEDDTDSSFVDDFDVISADVTVDINLGNGPYGMRNY